MSQVGTVAWLAIRELWISFRLLLVLVAFVGAGAIVALLPAPPLVTLGRLGAGLGVATIVAAGVTAWSTAHERTAGRAGWLVTRSVARGTYLGGWFIAQASISLGGIACAAALGWLAIAGVPIGVEWLSFTVAFGALAATSTAALAMAMTVGSLLRATPALAIVILCCAAIGALAWLVPGTDGVVPGSAYASLSRVADSQRGLPTSLRETGIGLVLTAGLLVVARLAFERAEL